MAQTKVRGTAPFVTPADVESGFRRLGRRLLFLARVLKFFPNLCGALEDYQKQRQMGVKEDELRSYHAHMHVFEKQISQSAKHEEADNLMEWTQEVGRLAGVLSYLS